MAPTLAASWGIDADKGVPQEWKDFIERTFFPLRDEFMAYTLYHGDVDFGHVCFEKVFEGRDGYLKPVRLKPLLHDITEICIGRRGNFIGIRQVGQDLGLENAMHVGFRVEGSYLYGIPLLENARETYNWWLDCNEGARRYDRKIAGAHIIVEYPDGWSYDRQGNKKPNRDLAREILDRLESAGGVAVPRDMAPFINQLNIESPGWKIWILDAGTSQQVGFVDRLGFLDKLLCRAFHIPERAVLEGQHGTLAEAESHMDVVFTIQDIVHRRITQAVNTQAVDQVLRLNFGPEAEGKVRLVASPIVDEKKALFVQVYQSMLGSPLGQQELAVLDTASMATSWACRPSRKKSRSVPATSRPCTPFRGCPPSIRGSRAGPAARASGSRPRTRTAGRWISTGSRRTRRRPGQRDFGDARGGQPERGAEKGDRGGSESRNRAGGGRDGHRPHRRAEAVGQLPQRDGQGAGPDDRHRESGGEHAAGRRSRRPAVADANEEPLRLHRAVHGGMSGGNELWQQQREPGRTCKAAQTATRWIVSSGPDRTSETVYIVDQAAPPDFTRFDESKAMIGFRSVRRRRRTPILPITSPAGGVSWPSPRCRYPNSNAG